MFVYFQGFLKKQFIFFYEMFHGGPSALRKYELAAVSGLIKDVYILRTRPDQWTRIYGPSTPSIHAY